ncbi:MAG: acyl-CoA dehydrogenase family protein [Actinomycetota bacterium]
MPQAVEAFIEEARAWLDAAAERAPAASKGWGEGEFSVAVFPVRTPDEERAFLDTLAAWQQRKAAEGYHAITMPTEFGGLGLSDDHALAFARIEAEYDVPGRHELFSVTTGLVAPTVAAVGTEGQKARFVESFLTASSWCCQLFSEPGAGSDLASLACRADRDGDRWILNGQKVWSSGAHLSEWGILIARTDPTVAKHRGLTAFLVPLDSDGVDVRPIKQISGSESFCEVFLSDVRIDDDLRLGEIGSGWSVALTTLAHERANSSRRGATHRPGGSAQQVLDTARAFGGTEDLVLRQRLAQVVAHERIRLLSTARVAGARRAGASPGPEGSIGKLFWVNGLAPRGDVVASVLGPRLVADTGEWGSYGWGEHVLGAPGYRIAGGSDEVQRNIIGERVLGLPGEPRVDKDVPWNEIPR